jgi:4-amino-4-deoxy-L-arabinose transferase-like glycosyltransferase
MTVHPTFLILSGSINNDCLVVMLMTATTYYLIKWNEEPSTKNIIVLALTTGLSVMTKSNGALMAIPIIYIFLKKWIQKMKKEKKWNWNYIKQFIIFGKISLPIGVWFQTYQYLHFGHYAVPALPSINLEKHYTFVERFLSIDLKSLLITPFCTFINWIDTEHNIKQIFGK